MWYNSFGKVLGLVILIFALLAGLAFGLIFYGQYRQINDPVSNTNFSTNTATVINNNLTNTSTLVTPDADDDPFLGPADAPVEIIAFEDFQCPYCERAAPIIMDVLAQYPNDVKFVYRDFPLYTIHDKAIEAARAAECADAQGKFWAWHDEAYENQSALNAAPEIFSIWAEDAGLDVTTYEACVEANTYATEVQKDQDEGLLAGVRATPTFFVNGYKVEGVLAEEQWKEIIDAALAK